jgi:hypothetical protein
MTTRGRPSARASVFARFGRAIVAGGDARAAGPEQATGSRPPTSSSSLCILRPAEGGPPCYPRISASPPSLISIVPPPRCWYLSASPGLGTHHMRTLATLALLTTASAANAQLTEARWSTRFPVGVSHTIFEDGALCLKAFNSPQRPAPSTSAASSPPSTTPPVDPLPSTTAPRSPRSPRSVDQYHNEGVFDFTIYPVNGVPRLTMVGFFNAPGSKQRPGLSRRPRSTPRHRRWSLW